MTQKVYISTNKKIGQRCRDWAANNLPKDFELTDVMEECDIFISTLYDKILSSRFISDRKCYNFHPALLPEYAGVGTMTWSILNKEPYHGVTLIEIEPGIDTGDVIAKHVFPIDPDDTAETLTEKTMDELYEFFKQKFRVLLSGKYETRSQDVRSRNLYTYKDLDEVLNLTQYMKATYFPGKPGPYFYNSKNEKVVLSYE